MWCALKLQEYDIVINYRWGKANGNADALSRPSIAPTKYLPELSVTTANGLLNSLRTITSAQHHTRSKTISLNIINNWMHWHISSRNYEKSSCYNIMLERWEDISPVRKLPVASDKNTTGPVWSDIKKWYQDCLIDNYKLYYNEK